MKILDRDTFLGNISPITGAMITADMLVTSILFIQELNTILIWSAVSITPSFTPGLYHEGDGKDLGHM